MQLHLCCIPEIILQALPTPGRAYPTVKQLNWFHMDPQPTTGPEGMALSPLHNTFPCVYSL